MRPVRRKFKVTNPYKAPGDYAAGYHTGVDFGCPTGTTVRACRGGRVVSSSFDDDYGSYVIVEGRFRTRSKHWLYAHLTARYVSQGERVRFAQAIGRSGETGNTDGAHLHLEQRHQPFGYHDHQWPTAALPPWRLPKWLRRRR